jgi:hypothetical protein
MILDELAKYLQDNGIGTVGTNIFKSYSPNKPDSALIIYETGGDRPQDTFGSTNVAAWENPRIQIVSRSTEYQTARNTAEDAYKTLIGIANQTIKANVADSGSFYLRVSAMQSPFRLGIDQNSRNLVACNFDVMKTLST